MAVTRIILALAATAAFLTSCARQHDTIAIDAKGLVTVESEILFDTSADAQKDTKDMEFLMSRFRDLLVKAGWTVQLKVLSAEKAEVHLSASITDIESVPGLYTVAPTEDPKLFSITFPQPSAVLLMPPWTRSITFKRRFWKADAEIIGPNGMPIREIPEVKNDVTCAVRLR